MASNSELLLQSAVSAVERAFARLDAATQVTLHERAEAGRQRDAVQAELTQGWQSHAAQLETSLSHVQSENEFLKEDNLRLSNQLQQLQQDYMELQKIAQHTVGRLDASVKQLDLMLEH